MINLDDDDKIAKIDEEMHNYLNTLFSSSMSLNKKYPIQSDEPNTSHGLGLSIVPLPSYMTFDSHDNDWEVDDLFNG